MRTVGRIPRATQDAEAGGEEASIQLPSIAVGVVGCGVVVHGGDRLEKSCVSFFSQKLCVTFPTQLYLLNDRATRHSTLCVRVRARVWGD